MAIIEETKKHEKTCLCLDDVFAVLHTNISGVSAELRRAVRWWSDSNAVLLGLSNCEHGVIMFH